MPDSSDWGTAPAWAEATSDDRDVLATGSREESDARRLLDQYIERRRSNLGAETSATKHTTSRYKKRSVTRKSTKRKSGSSRKSSKTKRKSSVWKVPLYTRTGQRIRRCPDNHHVNKTKTRCTRNKRSISVRKNKNNIK